MVKILLVISVTVTLLIIVISPVFVLWGLLEYLVRIEEKQREKEKKTRLNKEIDSFGNLMQNSEKLVKDLCKNTVYAAGCSCQFVPMRKSSKWIRSLNLKRKKKLHRFVSPLY